MNTPVRHNCYVFTNNKHTLRRDIIYYVRTPRRGVLYSNIANNVLSERADIINYVPTLKCLQVNKSYIELTLELI